MSGHRRRSGKKLLGYRARGKTYYGDRLGAPPSRRQRAANSRKPRPDDARGPTGEQQKTLAALCRESGIEYPAPKTAARAKELIRQLLVERGRRPSLSLDNQRGPTGLQQKELAALCRQHGVPYSFPKTAAEAADQIGYLRAERGSGTGQ